MHSKETSDTKRGFNHSAPMGVSTHLITQMRPTPNSWLPVRPRSQGHKHLVEKNHTTTAGASWLEHEHQINADNHINF